MTTIAAVPDWSGDGRGSLCLVRFWPFARLKALEKARTVREIATLHFLTGTLAGVCSRLTRATYTPTHYSNREGVRVRVRVLAADTCCVCGGTVEDGLARLGSTHCHDCRRGSALRNPARI